MHQFNSTKFRPFVWLLVVSIGSPLAAATYDSPQGVHAVARAAIVKGDSKTLVECLTPDSMEMWAWTAATIAMLAREKLKEDGELDKVESVDDAFSELGMPIEKMKWVTFKVIVTEKHDRERVMHDWARTVVNKPRFSSAMCNVIKEHSSALLDAQDAEKARDFDPTYPCRFMNSEIIELQMRENDARAYLEQAHEGKTVSHSLHFRKSSDGWLIHFPMDIGRWRERELVRQGFDTPLQAYRFARAYHLEGNLDYLRTCITPNSLSRTTASVIAQLIVQLEKWDVEDSDSEKLSRIRENVLGVLRKHRVPINEISRLGTTTECVDLLREGVPDIPALLADLLDESKLGVEIDGSQWKSLLHPVFETPSIEVEETGDQATAIIAVIVNGVQGTSRLQFKRVDDGWLLDL